VAPQRSSPFGASLPRLGGAIWPFGSRGHKRKTTRVPSPMGGGGTCGTRSAERDKACLILLSSLSSLACVSVVLRLTREMYQRQLNNNRRSFLPVVRMTVTVDQLDWTPEWLGIGSGIRLFRNVFQIVLHLFPRFLLRDAR